jgi:hypothetical protein
MWELPHDNDGFFLFDIFERDTESPAVTVTVFGLGTAATHKMHHGR